MKKYRVYMSGGHLIEFFRVRDEFADEFQQILETSFRVKKWILVK